VCGSSSRGDSGAAEAASAASSASPSKPNGPVYGASYPPEMIEAMMQEYNARHAGGSGGSFWGGRSKTEDRDRERESERASGSTAPSLPHASTPGVPSPPTARGADALAPLEPPTASPSHSTRAAQDPADLLAGAVIGTGHSDGRAEAAAAAAAAAREGGGGGEAGVHGGRHGVASAQRDARSSKDCRTLAKYDEVGAGEGLRIQSLGCRV